MDPEIGRKLAQIEATYIKMGRIIRFIRKIRKINDLDNPRKATEEELKKVKIKHSYENEEEYPISGGEMLYTNYRNIYLGYGMVYEFENDYYIFIKDKPKIVYPICLSELLYEF
jgi:hypothetical protein